MPYMLAHVGNVALIASLSYKGLWPKPPWAGRGKSKKYNATKNLIPFWSLVFVAHLASVSIEVTATAYLFSAVAHYWTHVMAVLTGSTIAFIESWLAPIGIFHQTLIVGQFQID